MNFSCIIFSTLTSIACVMLFVCLLYVGVPSRKPDILTYTAIAGGSWMLFMILSYIIYRRIYGYADDYPHPDPDEQVDHNSRIQPIHNPNNTINESSTQIYEKQMPPQLAVAMYIQQEKWQNNDATVLYIREQQADIREQQAQLDQFSIPIADLVQEV